MNVQAAKLELMQLILESNDSALLDSLRELLTSYKEEKVFIPLTPDENEAIDEGLEDFENRRLSDLDDFMKRLG